MYQQLIASHPCFEQLSKLGHSTEGNFMLKHLTPDTLTSSTDSQAKFWISLVRELDIHSPNLLEIGTNKGMFLLFALLCLNIKHAVSFDVLPGAADAVRILNQSFDNRVTFIPGDSRVTVPEYCARKDRPAIDIVWIDGGHDYDTACSDLSCCIVAQPRLILVDDYKQSTDVNNVVRDLKLLYTRFGYRTCVNPWDDDDYKGIFALRR
jgi:hypothetical protein